MNIEYQDEHGLDKYYKINHPDPPEEQSFARQETLNSMGSLASFAEDLDYEVEEITDEMRANIRFLEQRNVDEPAVCRICLCEEEEDKPIVSACKCAGSVG